MIWMKKLPRYCENTTFTIVSRKRAHYGLSAHLPVCLNFLLRSKTYLKERPSSSSIANSNRDFPLSSKPEDVVRRIYTTTTCKLHSCTVVYTSTRCLAHNVTHYLHCFEHLAEHNIDSSSVGPLPSLSPRSRCTAHGPFLRDYGTRF